MRIASVGDFIGEAQFFTGEPLHEDLVVATPTRLVAWRTDTLRVLMQTQANVGASLQRQLGKSLVRRLAPDRA